MSTTCRACRREPTDMFLCTTCTNALEKVIAELPAGINDLQIAATRQAKIDSPQRIVTIPDEDAVIDDEHRKIPAYLRSKHARIALIATPMPVNLDAATLHAQAVNGISTWARHLAETRGVDFPARDRLANGWPVTLETMCTWLVENIDSIRLDEAAGQIYTQLLDLAACIENATDRHAPDVFAGRCESMVTSLVIVDDTLVPAVDRCGRDLFCHEDDDTVKCPGCGTTYDLAKQRASMLDLADDEWARPQLIADALTELDEPVNASTLRTWILRDERVGRRAEGPVHKTCSHSSCSDMRRVDRGAGDRPLILQRGIDDDGRALYRVGDVRARIAWAKHKGRERMTG